MVVRQIQLLTLKKELHQSEGFKNKGKDRVPNENSVLDLMRMM